MSRHYTPQDEATLVSQLNHLLHSLALPLSLISPTDLTPRLLIAILESLLGARLPLAQISAHDSPDAEADARTARVQSMKIFLGVLETDILQRDAGLSSVDPRRLADGDDAEVWYVAEVLCAIGRDRDRGVPLPCTPSPSPSPSPPLSPLPDTIPKHGPPLSPKSQLDLDAESLFQTRSTTTRQTHPSLFSPAPFLAHDNTATSSLFSEHHEDEYGRASDDGGYSDDHDDSDTGVSDILGGLPPLPSTPPPPSHPSTLPVRRHHQNGHTTDTDEDRSLLFSAVHNAPIPREQAFSAYHHDPASIDNSGGGEGAARLRAPVRYGGFIAPVDEAQELASFELSRSRSASLSIGSHSRGSGLGLSSGTGTGMTPRAGPRGSESQSVKAQYTRTLELLNERARLLTQLSELRGAAAVYGPGYGHGHGHG